MIDAIPITVEESKLGARRPRASLVQASGVERGVRHMDRPGRVGTIYPRPCVETDPSNEGEE